MDSGPYVLTGYTVAGGSVLERHIGDISRLGLFVRDERRWSRAGEPRLSEAHHLHPMRARQLRFSQVMLNAYVGP
jgi:hypothetical protein